MSLPDGLRKRSFGTEWPRVAFLDPKYTYSLPTDTTMSCALDAFSHAAESYLSPKSTAVSRLFAVYAAKNIWSVIKNEPTEYSEKDRQTLQNAATAAGLAISVTGTGFPHPLGYSLTMKNGTPHGAACAVFYRHYLEYNMKDECGRRLISEFCNEINAELSELTEKLPKLSGVYITLLEDEAREYVDLISSAKNFTNSPYTLSDEEKIQIYRELFVK
jgi:alcohol dehydrogenase